MEKIICDGCKFMGEIKGKKVHCKYSEKYNRLFSDEHSSFIDNQEIVDLNKITICAGKQYY